MSVSPQPDSSDQPEDDAPSDVSDTTSASVAERQLAEIRDLLFGEQIRFLQAGISVMQRDLTERIDAVSEKLSRSIEQTRQDFNGRLDELGRHVETLNSAQQNYLATEIDDVSSQLQALQKSTEQGDQTLERQLQDMATALHQDISTRTREMMERLTQTQLELRDSKADRKTLASLLDRMASELNQDS